MTTLLLALAAILLPVFPAGSIGLIGLTYVAHQLVSPINDWGEIVLFYGAIGGVLAALTGW